jgi:hypothetical protein
VGTRGQRAEPPAQDVGHLDKAHRRAVGESQEALARGLGPVVFGELGARFRCVADRRERRGQHDTPGAPVARGTQHPQHALAGGDDQLVGILGLDVRDGRGDVMDLLAAGHRGGPTVVGRR